MSYLGLLFANLGRKKVRTWLTFLSIVVCFLLFGLLRTVGGMFSGPVNLAGVDRLVVSPKYSIIDPLPISHMNVLRGLSGVQSAAHADWFGGNYLDFGLAFPTIPVKPREYFNVYSELEITQADLDAFENTRTGAVASRSTAERFGWQIGDTIPIMGNIYPQEDGALLWEFELVGIYDRPNSSGGNFEDFYIHYDYFEEAKQHSKGMIGWISVKVDHPDEAALLASDIDALFENSRNPTRTMTENEYNAQFTKQLGNIGMMINMILTAVFFSILLLVANTMIQSFRERLSDLGVLKALGFNDGWVARMVLYESLLLNVGGAVVGIGLSYLSLIGLEPMLSNFGVVELTSANLIFAMAIAALLGLVVGAIPAIRASSLPIVDVLKARG